MGATSLLLDELRAWLRETSEHAARLRDLARREGPESEGPALAIAGALEAAAEKVEHGLFVTPRR